MNLKFLMILVFFIVFLGSNVFSAPLKVDLENEKYFAGETVQGKIFFDNSVQEKPGITDFHLDLNGSVINVYPVLIDLVNYTYFYFDLPYNLDNGSYNLVIEEIFYLKNNILVKEDQLFGLNIDFRNDSVLGVDPGVIAIDINKDKSFKLNIKNPSDSPAHANISTSDSFISPDKDYVLLRPGSVKIIDFMVYFMFVDRSKSFIFVNYENYSYKIPVMMGGFFSEKENETKEDFEGNLSFLEEEFNLTISLDQSLPGFVKVYNNLGEVIFDIKVSISGNLKEFIDLEFPKIDSLESGEVLKNHIYINENKDINSGNYSGKIDLIYKGEIYDSVLIGVEVLGEEVSEMIDIDEGGDEDSFAEEQNNDIFILISIIVLVLFILVAILIKYKKSKKQEKKSIF